LDTAAAAGGVGVVLVVVEGKAVRSRGDRTLTFDRQHNVRDAA